MELKITDITHKYGNRIVLDHITLEASSGMQVGILGANGSGKSTLLSHLGDGGCDPGDGGWGPNPRPRDHNPRPQGAKVGGFAYVPQENPLIEELNAWDNLRMWYGRDELKAELDQGFLKLLGINEFLKVKVKHMSGGMKKRLAIGCAICNDPQVLLLDEPMTALDLICKDVIRQYLREFRSRGGIVIMATHDESEIRECDKLYILKDGHAKIAQYEGDIKKLIDQF